MKSTFKGFAGNVLFVLNVFILFLLLFEEKLVIPLWLQPMGRMHPLMLHFPIAILMLSMFLEFFRFKTSYNTQEFFRDFTSNVLLVGVLTSAITVIMGLFLAREEGYSGDVLQWHKWTGISIVFVASFIYWYRNAAWYKAPVARAGAIVTTLCLIFAGHFGATLTHGDNFILEPITSSQVEIVPLEQAVVFDHVIQPILENKCISCHNPDKIKGELMLTDAQALLKGGKTGKLFVPGKPHESLLLKRVHLPLADKKHMPPKGKTQLTEEEIILLELWVKKKADFKKKLIEFPANDSLRVLASALFTPAERTEDIFQFASADENTIEQLNTDYRVISPLATESPALTVNFYNPKAFTSQSLDELKEIKSQIVSLELSKMPVKDTDLKSIRQFENLRKLNLNFTRVTGKGLQELAALPHLQNLSLSGTQVTYQDVKQHIGSFKKLHTLAIWNTPLTASEIGQLQKANKHIEFIGGYRAESTQPIKLNTPQVKNKSTVFEQSVPLQLFHPIKGVDIRYTTDGSEPDSIRSPLFDKEIILQGNTTIKARAYKSGWYGSDIAIFNFYKNSYKPDSVILLSRLNKVHQADGPKTFFNRILGGFNANSPAWANHWAGYFRNDMEVLLEFKNPIKLSSVALNTLIEPETIIFPPEEVEIWGGTTRDQMKLISTLKPELPKGESKPFIKLISCTFKPTENISYLKIVAKPVKKLPAWHTSKHRPAMLLVDELLLN
ncbi:cytochrome C [Rhodocytophaga rosea]|uniref:Cytochrome C n=1 Tax=Rhodocytophaga rosea TaxID=2704465 RepID=A0A6C0GTZ3_9BACT|nr:c-type cytochrome domain-containing protein [Rhodocytophaga rosea]QHT71655.1 cytochrome C [Rhodocytophaga rosea]